MPHRGRRSLEARQRRYLRSRLLDTSYRDRERAECVARLTEEQMYNLLKDKFEEVDVHLVRQHVKGEILVDSKGLGSFQKPPKVKANRWNGKGRH